MKRGVIRTYTPRKPEEEEAFEGEEHKRAFIKSFERRVKQMESAMKGRKLGLEMTLASHKKGANHGN